MDLEYRCVEKKDIKDILKLYHKYLPYGKMTIDKYNYWYKNKANDEEYYSRILTYKNEIIAHNAFIDRKIYCDGNLLSVKLSSGGMVESQYSGVFYKLLKEGIKEFKDSIIIAFPNGNSEPFFTKIFKFNTLKKNFFTLEKQDFNTKVPKVGLHQKMTRTDLFLQARLDNHIVNDYKKIELDDNYLYYKSFGTNTADIIFVHNFNASFISLLKTLFKEGFDKINIIHWDFEYITQIGFKYSKNNLFVYKGINEVFECQMIDSDIF